jgi:hypothetical protein
MHHKQIQRAKASYRPFLKDCVIKYKIYIFLAFGTESRDEPIDPGNTEPHQKLKNIPVLLLFSASWSFHAIVFSSFFSRESCGRATYSSEIALLCFSFIWLKPIENQHQMQFFSAQLLS